MKDFFDLLYYFTNSMYSDQLDNYLCADASGYLHVGLFMLLFSLIVSAVFYYAFAPVRKQLFWWLIYAAINGAINFVSALYFTCSPLINNKVAPDERWEYLDSFMFGVTNIFWSVIFFTVIALIIKWGSTAKYVPFKKF